MSDQPTRIVETVIGPVTLEDPHGLFGSDDEVRALIEREAKAGWPRSFVPKNELHQDAERTTPAVNDDDSVGSLSLKDLRLGRPFSSDSFLFSDLFVELRNQPVCACPIDALMSTGCRCGVMRQERDGRGI